MNRQDNKPLLISPENQLKYAGQKPRWWYDGTADDIIVSIEQISIQKQVIVFAEFGSDGLLNLDLDELHARYLPVDDVVSKLVDAWRISLDRFHQDQAMSDEVLDWKPFADEGYQLAKSLKQVLPEWTVHYADQLLYYCAPDGGYCPEVLLDGKLGFCRIEMFRNMKIKEMEPAFFWPKPPR